MESGSGLGEGVPMSNKGGVTRSPQASSPLRTATVPRPRRQRPPHRIAPADRSEVNLPNSMALRLHVSPFDLFGRQSCRPPPPAPRARSSYDGIRQWSGGVVPMSNEGGVTVSPWMPLAPTPPWSGHGRRTGLDCGGRGSGHHRGEASNPGSLSRRTRRRAADAAQGSGRGRLRRGAREAGQRSRTASARGEESWVAVADGFGRWGRGHGAGGGEIAGKGWRGLGRDCREEDGAGGGWSGGTVRVVDALAPALRCSRDFLPNKQRQSLAEAIFCIFFAK
jgi:hypothetical protein